MKHGNVIGKRLLASGIVLLIFATWARPRAQNEERWTPTEAWFSEPRLYERPKAGFIPNKESAIIVGRTIIAGAYGKRFAQGIEPIDAKLFGDVWVVYSYFKPGKLVVGGVTTVEISKTSGAILNLTSER